MDAPYSYSGDILKNANSSCFSDDLKENVTNPQNMISYEIKFLINNEWINNKKNANTKKDRN